MPVDPKHTPEINRTTLRVAWRLLARCGRGEARRFYAAAAVLLATSTVSLLQPWPMKLIIDVVLRQKAPPGFLADTFASVREHVTLGGRSDAGLLLILCLAILTTQVLAGALSVLNTYITVSLGLRMVYKLRCSLFEHVQRLSVRFHDETPVGDSLHRIAWDAYCVQSLFNGGVVPAASAALMLFGITLVVARIDWTVAVIALAVSIPLLFLIRRLDRPMRDRSRRAHERESEISSRLQETLLGIRVVQAFGQEAGEAERFRQRADDSLRAKLRVNVLQTCSQAAVGTVLAAGTATGVWLVSRRVLHGELSIGDVVLIVGYLTMLFKPLETLAHTAGAVQSAVAGADRVFAILEATPDVSEPAESVALPSRARGHLTLDNVSFGYRPGHPVLHDIRIDLPPGSTLALVGESGAGKTTLISLLLRFYDPTAGRVLLDGEDLRNIRLASLRDQVALVPQEPVLFSATIRENIAYARPGATLDEIRAAARAAAAEEFILATPDGYDSQIGQRGVSLSGGQRQRLSIARAFLKDAPVLIMDEPTSALDAESESHLVRSMASLMLGRTTVIIAHRLSTVRNASRVAVLAKGRVVEEGTYAELITRGGAFTHLHNLQSGPHGFLRPDPRPDPVPSAQ
jgi:ATP-binding cassette subfamily B protein/subfamily B ATP-binding cassette protein MsbA